MVLITGVAGYIGSHTVFELINAGHSVVVVDNLSNSSYMVISRIEKITGANNPFYKIDIRNYDSLNAVLDKSLSLN